MGKKPVAIQYHEEMRKNDCLPNGVYIVPTEEGDMPVIHTPKGDVIVREGDYIITNAKGEIYPCKSGIFQMPQEEIQEEIV